MIAHRTDRTQPPRADPGLHALNTARAACDTCASTRVARRPLVLER